MLHRNLPLKAASILLAIFLWFWVTLAQENPIVETPVRTAVRAEGLQPGLGFAHDLPQVEVRLRGLKRDTADLRGRVQAFVSCRGLGPGRHRLSVHVRGPREATVAAIRPAEVLVTLESLVGQTKPVELELVGEPLPGYDVTRIRHSPKLVRVSGARSRVERVARLLARVDPGRMSPGTSLVARVQALDRNGDALKGIAVSPAEVTVSTELRPLVATLTLPVVVQTRGALPPEVRLLSVQVEPPMVTATLPAARADELEQVSTEELPLANVYSSFTRQLRVIAPEGVSLVNGPEVTVTVKVQRRPAPGAPGRDAAYGGPAN